MGNEFVDVTNMKLVNIVFPGLLKQKSFQNPLKHLRSDGAFAKAVAVRKPVTLFEKELPS